MKINVHYIDTSDEDYREWQLDHDQPMLICINCHRLVERRHPMQHRCEACHGKYNKKAKIRHKRTVKRRKNRIVSQKIKDKDYQEPRTWAKHQPQVCSMCGCTAHRLPFEVDHVLPLHNGGVHHPRNWQLLCHDCHALKTLGENLWLLEK